MSEKKEYKTGQMQDNGLMYDSVYDYNHDGKVDWVEDSVRREEMRRMQQLAQEEQQEPHPQSPKVEASASSGGCLGSALVVFFCILGIALCFTTENDWLKVLFIFGGVGCAVAGGYFCGLFGTFGRKNSAEDNDSLAATKSPAGKKKTIALIAAVALTVLVISLAITSAQSTRKSTATSRTSASESATSHRETTRQTTTAQKTTKPTTAQKTTERSGGTRVKGSGSIGTKGYSGNTPYSKSGGNKKTATTKKATTKEYDPYHAADYVDPDDFYYDYYDDFYDYYDAEDYWYEHQ